MQIDQIIIFISALVIIFAGAVVLRHSLQMMQQNSYRNDRYLKWLKSNIKILPFFVGLLIICIQSLTYIIAFAFLIVAILELRKKYKKPLVWTKRAVRLYVASIVVTIVVVGFISNLLAGVNTLYTLINIGVILFAFSQLIIMAGIVVTKPIENAINRYYYNDAVKILRSMPRLKIIGITGSYGKTSTKHYLHTILSERFNVLMTPGSYNTTLGVIRTIREQMKPYHDIFIVEMGAKQLGDIKEICDLVHPQIGILTSVGAQHLESFKSIKNIQKTKFELIDSLPSTGIAVLNNDFEMIESRKVTNLSNVLRYSTENLETDYHVENVRYKSTETLFDIVNREGSRNEFATKLVGSCNLSNVLAGYIVAKELGMTMPEVGLGISRIEQVEHRLNMKRTAGGITIIDDAFNSNPNGAKMALDVIKGFESGRRIVVTPGLIELGDKQYYYNHLFGKQISTSCDLAVVVGLYNRDAIVAGLRDGGFDSENLITVSSFADAMKYLKPLLKSGDVILYENDLPDTFK